jgi:hypothetical protein
MVQLCTSVWPSEALRAQEQQQQQAAPRQPYQLLLLLLLLCCCLLLVGLEVNPVEVCHPVVRVVAVGTQGPGAQPPLDPPLLLLLLLLLLVWQMM